MPASKAKLPDGWCATKLCFLPLASRGGPEELQLGLHAPTYVVLRSKDILLKDSLSVAKDEGAPADDDMDDRTDEKELRPDGRLGGAPGIMGMSCAVELVRSPDWCVFIDHQAAVRANA